MNRINTFGIITPTTSTTTTTTITTFTTTTTTTFTTTTTTTTTFTTTNDIIHSYTTPNQLSDNIVAAINNASNETLPKRKLNRHAKPYWTAEVKAA